jgi:hypothetical protein
MTTAARGRAALRRAADRIAAAIKAIERPVREAGHGQVRGEMAATVDGLRAALDIVQQEAESGRSEDGPALVLSEIHGNIRVRGKTNRETTVIGNVENDIRERRLAAGLTLQNVADALGGRSKSMISNYEMGNMRLTATARERILDAIARAEAEGNGGDRRRWTRVHP